MPIRYITNWRSKKFSEIIDVRSPEEYNEDHIPTAINLPVLNNNERTKIGSIYNKRIRLLPKNVASLISKNIGSHIKENFLDKPGNWKPLIYLERRSNQNH